MLTATVNSYSDFLARKRRRHQPHGFKPHWVHPQAFGFQRHIIEWSLPLGSSAIFSDCGTGKTLMEQIWAVNVAGHTGMPVLMLAPLAVSHQSKREGKRFGIDVNICRSQADVRPGLNITNYEMLGHFDPRAFGGVVLDESSILKSYTGKIRNQIIESFAATPYRLAGTATPSPNDFMELGNHAEFLGVMSRTAMLATFFNHDGGETSKWRLKGHAVKPFWEWVSSWAVMLRKPSDLGFSDAGYDLPPLKRHYHVVETEAQEGFLFPVEAATLTERRESRKVSLPERAARCALLVNETPDQWAIWGDLNAETDAATKAIFGAVQVAGPDSEKHKEAALLGFADGTIHRLVTKSKIAGFGMNFQNCHRMAFMGLSDSYESRYQAERRCWRFGQEHEVESHVFIGDRDGAVVRNQDRKQQQAEQMSGEMIEAMRRLHVRG